MSPTTINAACIQINSGADVNSNLEQIETMLQPFGTELDLLLLPENFALMGANTEAQRQIAEHSAGGKIQNWAANLARRHQLYLVAGSLPLQSALVDKVFTSSILYAPSGEVLARYDKIHLFDVEVHTSDGVQRYCESEVFCAGEQPVCAETELGKIGLSICYDLRFAELYRALVAQGAMILTVPSAFTAATGKDHWLPLLQARAIENQCFVLGAAQVGTHPSGRKTYGHSVIIDPWGKILAQADDAATQIVVASLDIGYQQQLRQQFPCLQHRRL